ncbi:MAG: hypothetical protein IPJ42_17930 [Betaproteobacteria bacterium]|nr:hypothetical protein [Betaproteobacteria bacterium]
MLVDVPLSGEIVARVFFEIDGAELDAAAGAELAAGGQGLGRHAPSRKLVDRRLPRSERRPGPQRRSGWAAGYGLCALRPHRAGVLMPPGRSCASRI